jgi:hypothetical protein
VNTGSALGRGGLAATGASLALTVAVAAAGPSVMEPPLPGPAGQPPWSLTAHLPAHLAVALSAAALVTGTAGAGLSLAAGARGWRPRPRALLLTGIAVAVLLALLPPFGSADHLSYAAYGRMAATGHDPYAAGPDALARLGDPVARAVQRWGDWQATPSVYGPLATGGQALASLIGRTSVRATVFVLSLLNAAAFAGAGLLLHRLARGDRARQARAAILWTLNPLLLYELAAGAHLDTQLAFFAVAAVAVFSRRSGSRPAPATRAAARCAMAGALAGLAFSVKLTGVLVLGGLAWAIIAGAGEGGREGQGYPRSQRAAQLAALAGGFAAVAGTALALAGQHALGQVLRGSSYVSISSPWRAVRALARLAFGHTAAGALVSAGSVLLAVVLLVVLLRGLPEPGRAPGLPGGGDRIDRIAASPAADSGDLSRAARAVLAFVLAWLFAWPYLLPWYDALGWVLLPLIAWSWVDWVLLARTAALAVGYLPARASVRLPADLGWLQSVVRTGVTPAALTVTIAALVLLAGRTAGTQLPATGTGGGSRADGGREKEGTMSRWLTSLRP